MTSTNSDDAPGARLPDDLKGLDILLVEDSWDLGDAMKDLLELLGAEVAGPAATTAEAEHLLATNTPDVALVDFHLRDGELSTGLIARLHERGIPVVLISGSEFFPSRPENAFFTLEKPVSESQLLEVLRPIVAQKAARPQFF